MKTVAGRKAESDVFTAIENDSRACIVEHQEG